MHDQNIKTVGIPMLGQNAVKNLKQTSDILYSYNLYNKYVFISNVLMSDDWWPTDKVDELNFWILFILKNYF